MSIYTEAKEAFEERFENVLNGTEELGQYWQDDISEMADSLVPIYTSEIVKEWTEDGYPEVSDMGLIEGLTDVTRIMEMALYERYSEELYSLADGAGFND